MTDHGNDFPILLTDSVEIKTDWTDTGLFTFWSVQDDYIVWTGVDQAYEVWRSVASNMVGYGSILGKDWIEIEYFGVSWLEGIDSNLYYT